MKHWENKAKNRAFWEGLFLEKRQKTPLTVALWQKSSQKDPIFDRFWHFSQTDFPSAFCIKKACQNVFFWCKMHWESRSEDPSKNPFFPRNPQLAIGKQHFLGYFYKKPIISGFRPPYLMPILFLCERKTRSCQNPINRHIWDAKCTGKVGQKAVILMPFWRLSQCILHSNGISQNDGLRLQLPEEKTLKKWFLRISTFWDFLGPKKTLFFRNKRTQKLGPKWTPKPVKKSQKPGFWTKSWVRLFLIKYSQKGPQTLLGNPPRTPQ